MLFAQSVDDFDNRLLLSLGLRLDGSSFNSLCVIHSIRYLQGLLSYAVTDKFNVNLSGGRFTHALRIPRWGMKIHWAIE